MHSNRWLVKLSSSVIIALIAALIACLPSFAQAPSQSPSAVAVPISCTDRSHPSTASGETFPSNDHSTASLSPRDSTDHERSLGSQEATIRGTVTDVNDGPISGAVVTLHGIDGDDCSVRTNNDGYFEIRDLDPKVSYHITVSALGFATWESPTISLEPGESKFVNASKLQILEVQTSVTVTPEDPAEIATEEVKTEEQQRGFLIIPNFYAVYSPNPAPLNAKLKFNLSLRVARDPFTLGGVTTYAAAQQAAGNPRYVQGFRGYAERLGANSVTSFADIMLDGAVFPSLLHQDPRYFYKGTGSKRSRVLHVFSSLVIARGDNGQLQPNFSSIGGDLASSSLANLYYPKANRGVGLIMQGFGIDAAVHVTIRMLDEFAFHPKRYSASQM
jgi:hypothetical protein